MSSRGFSGKKQKIYFAVIIVSLMSEIFITGHIINYECFFCVINMLLRGKCRHTFIRAAVLFICLMYSFSIIDNWNIFER